MHPTSPDWAGFGVYLEDNALPAWNQFKVDIYNNFVTDANKGIRLKDATWARVRGNTVRVKKHVDEPGIHEESRGIHVTNSVVNWISDNTVGSSIAADSYGWWDTGIRGDFNSLSIVSCNTTDSLHNAIFSGGTAPATYINNNVMKGYHYRGILQNYGYLATQGSPTNPTDNEWVNTFLFNHTDAYETSQSAQPFYARNVQPGTTTYWPGPFSAGTSVPNYQIELTSSISGATSNYDCDSIVYFRDSGHLKYIALDSLELQGSDSLALLRLTKLQVYRSVLNDSLLQEDSTLVAFKDTFALTDLGKLENVARQLGFGMATASTDKLAGDLNNISTTDTLSALWKETLLMRCNWSNDDSTYLSASDSSRLWLIGALCPYLIGSAVYEARTMLFSLDSAFLSLENSCEQPIYFAPSERLANEEDPTEEVAEDEFQASVYPNPASHGILNVQLLGESDEIYNLFIHSIDGSLVDQFRLTTKLSTVDVSTISSGIYFLSIRSVQNEIVFKEKVVLIHD